jgi:hypothetical protein
MFPRLGLLVTFARISQRGQPRKRQILCVSVVNLLSVYETEIAERFTRSQE